MNSGTGAPAEEDNAKNSIGIRLLEMPVNRADDPRAQVYIVDHLAPGAVIKRHVLVTNSSPAPQHIEVFPGAAGIDDDAFNALAGRATSELTSWISLDRTAVDLPPGGSEKVLVTIAVDPIASTGERYGVIWAETSAPSNTPDNVLMVTRVGVRIYLDVGPGGEPPPSFDVGSLTPSRDGDRRPAVVASVHNTGGRALDMVGELSLSDGPGGVSAGPFPVSTAVTLLPGRTAGVRTVLDQHLPDGPWKARLTLRSGFIEKVVTATITFPASANTVGGPVRPENWFERHPLLSAGLGMLVGAALVGTFFARRWLVSRRRTRDEESPQGSLIEV
ncbi:hypothetical protein Lesp02_23470 [Lentzea sp. NBRC 105346]|uniref:hypothetical protein n=1 Tax=Lentzea sp. NBRC 105346 TaxID=3032205 RepID=UPI0024A15EF3|nr:hypothetical protein [Lentzea sp. NBRC 105346]GLZ30157.1 hypothetical protein Lesp02_23470 [Lentzea sp. NBRC 105346]